MDPSKLYVEYYAKLHTERAMRLWPMRLMKNERPDFITKRGEIGMEVTRAAIEEWAQQEADMNRHFGEDMPGEAVEQIILADCDCDDAIANGAEDGEEEGLFELPRDVKEMHVGRIIERIEDKTKALKEYRLCRENWLYVFSETTGLEREDVQRIQTFFDVQDGTRLFDKVLVKVGCQLYVLVRGEELSEITLRSRSMLAMHRRARRLAVRDGKKQK